jgi:F-type H+-transporting ATPase subunit b
MIGLDPGIIWVIVNILVLFFFLKKFLFKPVSEIIAKRQEIIANSLQDADDTKSAAHKLKSDYENELKFAGDKANEIIKEARDRADVEYNKILEKAREDAAKTIAEAHESIELERKKSMEAAQAEIAVLAMLAASKIIGKNVDNAANNEFIGDFLKEVGVAK